MGTYMDDQEVKLWREVSPELQVRFSRPANLPNADNILRLGVLDLPRSRQAVDVLLVNPPDPKRERWLSSGRRVSQRTARQVTCSQIPLAQLAALLQPAYKVAVVDARAQQMSWDDFEALLRNYEPVYYLTYLTAATLKNDMYGAFLAKSIKACTIGFGPYITPIPVETMRAFPSLDYALLGEPDLTLRDLIDHLDGRVAERPLSIQRLFTQHDPSYRPAIWEGSIVDMKGIKGLAWRQGDNVVVNSPRPVVQNLDDLPLPVYEKLLNLKYRMPNVSGPFMSIMTSRGCPGGCTFCLKHLSYQNKVLLRSPEKILDEILYLKTLGIDNIHMSSDLFTVNRNQVMDLCNRLIRTGLQVRWTCNSRVDYVDEEMLSLMGRAGCQLIFWGIESADRQILENVHKNIAPERVAEALRWSKKAGIRNWGYFIFGLPGETEDTIKETVRFSKTLPLDMALFNIAAPYPGTPLFYQMVKEGWFRPGMRFGQVDMDETSVIDYPDLPAERIQYWQRRAYREWTLRPRPILTHLKMLLSDLSSLKPALHIGSHHFGWSAK
jgi:anaerobic magnesium-protoporphyrin IX monomethyl ester cyclase